MIQGKIPEGLLGQKYSKDKLPIYTVIFKQFPNAIREVVKCSQAGHNKYIETDTYWDNFKHVPDPINQYRNAALRHMGEEGINEDMKEYGKCTHEGQTIWNLLAALEIELSHKKF